MKAIIQAVKSILFWRREIREQKEREDAANIKRIEREIEETTAYINELVEKTKRETEFMMQQRGIGKNEHH